MTKAPILIAGAGPTGLNLALSLAVRQVPFRLISQDSGPGKQSRAMVVHARTLEFYRQLGFADEVVSQGIPARHAHFWEAGNGHRREIASVSLEDMGAGLSPYPFLLTYPQDDHERFLLGKLQAWGADVEWNTRLTDFRQKDDHIETCISKDGGLVETWEASYLCGCDGAHSQVRETMGVQFPGGTYDQLFYVADVHIERGLDKDFYVSLGEHILSLMLPVRSSGTQRLIGLVPPELSDRRDLSFEDIRGHVEPLLDVKVTKVDWFSTYRVHHRVADYFRKDRAFLLGDAGHIHSPAGGQGMNTGIGDAVNLGWKLAAVVQGQAGASLLYSYEPERIGFARTLVATTDRAFTPMVATGLQGEFTRRVLAPLVLSVATRFSLTRHAAFRTLSQTQIHYEHSPLSEGEAGDVHGGDRLPWVGQGSDNFEPLRSMTWQMHVYGEATKAWRSACQSLHLPLHQFPFDAPAKEAGFRQDAGYLVRPDGYVGLALAHQNAADVLRAYLDKHQLRLPGERVASA